MSLECGTRDTDLIAFADGVSTLDDHVATCDYCQTFLAELWSGGLERDLAEPVVRALRFEEFMGEVGRIGFDLVARFAEAMMTYLGGREEDE